MTTCRSCGAPILWAETVNGKRIPLDETPDPAGSFTLDEEHEPPVAEHVAGRRGVEGDRFTCHLETCEARR